MRKLLPLALAVAAGCSGGPLKELPAFEPPPEVQEPPATAAEAETPELRGAWRSTAALGPGSAELGRVVLVFDGEGGLSGAAFRPSGASSIAGAYADLDGAVRVELGGGDVRVWAKELDGDRLVLRDGDRELRLERLR